MYYLWKALGYSDDELEYISLADIKKALEEVKVSREESKAELRPNTRSCLRTQLNTDAVADILDRFAGKTIEDIKKKQTEKLT